MYTKTIQLNNCEIEVEYEWDEFNEVLIDINDLTPTNGHKFIDILTEGITLKMIQDHIAENHVNEEPFEE